MRMGIIVVLHTFGADLKWHPHVHLLVTEGGLSLDGTRWVEPYNLGWLMQHDALKKMWRYHVIRAFRAAHRGGELRFPARFGFWQQYPLFNQMLSKLYELTWYAHIGACLLDPSASLRYIGRYTKRAVLAEYRITYYDGKKVRFAYRDYAEGGKTSFKTLPVLAFIGRLVRHIPDKGFKMVRYSGLFATRWRSQYLAQARCALGQNSMSETAPAPATETPLSQRSWHERQHAQGVDPLRCTHCGQRLLLREVAFGPHIRIERLFQLGGRPLRPFPSAYPQPP
jgi:hypothetical protein